MIFSRISTILFIIATDFFDILVSYYLYFKVMGFPPFGPHLGVHIGPPLAPCFFPHCRGPPAQGNQLMNRRRHFIIFLFNFLIERELYFFGGNQTSNGIQKKLAHYQRTE